MPADAFRARRESGARRAESRWRWANFRGLRGFPSKNVITPIGRWWVWRENPTTDTVSGAGHDERPVQGTGRLYWARTPEACTLPRARLVHGARSVVPACHLARLNRPPSYTDLAGM
jgi:hypothetical protein